MTDTPAQASAPARRLPQGEFIALVAVLMATVAFSVDAMLPALPRIGQELSPDFVNRAQLIVTSFVLGMGLGTIVTGPLSDRLGRKPVMIGGACLYIVAALIAWAAPSLEIMLAARLLQGIGASGPRVAAVAMIRDLYSGRAMARTMSFVMMVFSVVPALAPSLGAVIISVAGWRGIFLAFVFFSVVSMIWLTLRQPETLPAAEQRPLRWKSLGAAVVEVVAHPTARLSTLVQMLIFGMLFSTVSSTQQIFDITYGRGTTFQYWFGGIALVAATSSMLNARLVGRLGMRAMIKGMLTAQLFLSAGMVAAMLAPLPAGLEFGVYVIWTTGLFFQMGLTIGNLNALALEPMGHIAGLASSIVTAVATVGAVVIAIPVGLSFDGTPLPLAGSVFVLSVIALFLTVRIRRDSDE